jgi:hypothetical protein
MENLKISKDINITYILPRAPIKNNPRGGRNISKGFPRSGVALSSAE